MPSEIIGLIGVGLLLLCLTTGMPIGLAAALVGFFGIWYLVGLITSDGCLSSDNRHIDITSKDSEFLSGLKTHFHFTNKICKKYNSTGDLHYRLQLANRSLYEFLVSIGLSSRKSLTIKSLDVPEYYFCDFLRGLIDGDGGLQRWFHPSNGKEQWNLRVSSGSRNLLYLTSISAR